MTPSGLKALLAVVVVVAIGLYYTSRTSLTTADIAASHIRPRPVQTQKKAQAPHTAPHPPPVRRQQAARQTRKQKKKKRVRKGHKGFPKGLSRLLPLDVAQCIQEQREAVKRLEAGGGFRMGEPALTLNRIESRYARKMDMEKDVYKLRRFFLELRAKHDFPYQSDDAVKNELTAVLKDLSDRRIRMMADPSNWREFELRKRAVLRLLLREKVLLDQFVNVNTEHSTAEADGDIPLFERLYTVTESTVEQEMETLGISEPRKPHHRGGGGNPRVAGRRIPKRKDIARKKEKAAKLRERQNHKPVLMQAETD